MTTRVLQFGDDVWEEISALIKRKFFSRAPWDGEALSPQALQSALRVDELTERLTEKPEEVVVRHLNLLQHAEATHAPPASDAGRGS